MILTKEEILNQLCSAIEGGSNDWYNLHDLSMLPEESKGQPLVDRIFNAIYSNKKLEIPVSDVEVDEILGVISYANLQRADKLLGTEQYKWIVRDVKGENDDANTGDAFFQLVVMGELVYG